MPQQSQDLLQVSQIGASSSARPICLNRACIFKDALKQVLHVQASFAIISAIFDSLGNLCLTGAYGSTECVFPYLRASICRVRVDAAMALGATAHLLDDTSAMDKLIQFYTDRCFDKDTHCPKQHLFDNLSEQFVNQASSDTTSCI